MKLCSPEVQHGLVIPSIYESEQELAFASYLSEARKMAPPHKLWLNARREIINFQIFLSGQVLLTATRAVWIADDFAFQIALSHQVLCVSPWYIVSRVLEQVYRKIAQSCALACHEIVVQSSHRHNDKDSFY